MEPYFSHKYRPDVLKKSLIVFSSLFFIGIVFAVIALNFSTSPNTSSLSQFELDQEEFKSFMLKYNKHYSTPEEFLQRFQTFRENLAHFKEFNSQGHTWTKGVTKFADLTTEEFHAKYSQHYDYIETENIKEIEVTDTIVNVDWRAVPGVVTPVKNQHTCGNCYAFATSAAVESAWALKGNGLHSLSQQQITDCSVELGNMGCKGGNYLSTYEYIKQNGLVSQEIYPFVDHGGLCKRSLIEYPIAKISDYAMVQPNSTLALMAAVTQQPVSVLLDDTAMQHWTSGVIYNGCSLHLHHAVVIVGFQVDETQNTGYWIVKNSWGTDAGIGGYFYIGMQDGPGICGIQMAPYYPII